MLGIVNFGETLCLVAQVGHVNSPQCLKYFANYFLSFLFKNQKIKNQKSKLISTLYRINKLFRLFTSQKFFYSFFFSKFLMMKTMAISF